jgi:hypothetical protein
MHCWGFGILGDGEIARKNIKSIPRLLLFSYTKTKHSKTSTTL